MKNFVHIKYFLATNMPTIRSIDEAMEQDNEYSKTSTISFDSKGEEKDKTNKE
jgi:hypothetical protein